MKIVVNTRLLRKNQMDGIGWFTYNTLRHIVQQHPEVEFHFLFDSGKEREFLFGENVIPHNLFPPAKHPWLNRIWFEWSVKRVLNRVKPDLFLSPDGILCTGWPGKQYGVIHDINFFHNPEDLRPVNRKYYNKYFPQFAKKATRLATVSNYSKDDISNSFTVQPEKIDVVYCGINSFFHPASAAQATETRRKYTGGRNYFIFVGTISPRKNIAGLLQAFEFFKRDDKQEIQLLIVGGGMYKTSDIMKIKEKMNYGKDVIFTGRVNNEELNNLLGASIALTYIPYFEGFGIPLIEAMQCDVPVIASNSTSIPEIVGNAGILVDPDDKAGIAALMMKIVNDQSLRNDLVQKGRTRKQEFSWEKTSVLLWESIQKTL